MSESQDPAQPSEVVANMPESFIGALAALRRAAQRARLIAQETGTDLIVVRSGQVVRVRPEQKGDT